MQLPTEKYFTLITIDEKGEAHKETCYIAHGIHTFPALLSPFVDAILLDASFKELRLHIDGRIFMIFPGPPKDPQWLEELYAAAVPLPLPGDSLRVIETDSHMEAYRGIA